MILFEWKRNYGHYCTLIRNRAKNILIFTDPYGYCVEDEFSFIPISFLKLNDIQRGYLINLLINQPLKVHYSEYNLQQQNNNINTCGRFAIIRCEFLQFDEDEINDLMQTMKPKFNADELVTIMTYDV